LIGGNFQGKGPEQNATVTYVGKNATLAADAVTNGNGGTVIVWSDAVTRFHGTVQAQGGKLSGDGGFAEVSGKHLEYWGKALLGAPAGRGGRLLLDPDAITITDDLTDNSPQADVVFDVHGTTPTSNITVGTLEA